MKFITTIFAAFTVLLLTSCSKTDSQSTSSLTYPADAAAVAADTSFLQVYKSGTKSFYAHRLTSADISKMPEASVIKRGTNAVVFVAIQDGKLVEANAADRSEVESKIPPGMLQ